MHLCITLPYMQKFINITWYSTACFEPFSVKAMKTSCYWCFLLKIVLDIYPCWLHVSLNYVLSSLKFFFFKLRWVSVAVPGLSLVVGSKRLSSLQGWASRCGGFSCCRAQAQEFWCTGFVALPHVESSQTGDQSPVPFTDKRTPIHCITREVPKIFTYVFWNLRYNWHITLY